MTTIEKMTAIIAKMDAFTAESKKRIAAGESIRVVGREKQQLHDEVFAFCREYEPSSTEEYRQVRSAILSAADRAEMYVKI